MTFYSCCSLVILLSALYWFKSYGNFAEQVEFAYGGGVASGRVCPAACAAGFFNSCLPKVVKLNADNDTKREVSKILTPLTVGEVGSAIC